MSAAIPAPPAVISAVQHLNAGKYFQIAAFVMLVYDHVLTFSDEVERVWKQRMSGATVLFLINRYITPIQFIIIIDAFHDPRWTEEVCNQFVVFEGASTAALVGGYLSEILTRVSVIMILRVYALYGQSKWILGFLLLLLTTQIVITAIGLSQGTRVPLPPFLTGKSFETVLSDRVLIPCDAGCILTGDTPLFPAVWFMPLVTDTCIFVLTLWRARAYWKQSGSTPIMHIFLRDGAMYFFVIFLANLVNTVIYYTAVEDLKAIGATFSQLITATMISRLVLNLRSISDGRNNRTSSTAPSTLLPMQAASRRKVEDTFITRTIVGNLGEDIMTAFDSMDSESEKREYELNNVRWFRT
ncbi:hypothetical protein CVT24_011458 [Panaeolus cyanescens]|uniref:DUF6533 domain-containing protein n=1 Tax=Panaeolus cyanescens TaxID=181874 RepID=A0A409YGU7_9AGAR|nr:hypothetical protein CVT24_011458 [Panaeolus cyanescens]